MVKPQNGIIKVGMAEMGVTKPPVKLVAMGLGSCIGVGLYDPVAKIGGLIHIMLPEFREGMHGENKAKYADTGIPLLLDELVKIGAMKSRIIAKLAGGAQMFATAMQSPLLAVGDRNIVACKGKLQDLKIPVLGELVGGNTGKTFEMDLIAGAFTVREIGKEPVPI